MPKKLIVILQKLYNASVYYSDLIIQDLFMKLEDSGRLKDSTIIITSDHGEHLCDQLDHYLWDHITYQSVYISLIKVPLII